MGAADDVRRPSIVARDVAIRRRDSLWRRLRPPPVDAAAIVAEANERQERRIDARAGPLPTNDPARLIVLLEEPDLAADELVARFLTLGRVASCRLGSGSSVVH